jgi:integrase
VDDLWPAKPLKTPRSEQPIPIPRDLALLLSASVKTYPSEIMVTDGPGTLRCGPWVIERAMRDARQKIDGLPEGFTFHDLRHASARTTLHTYGHLWPDADESTRTAIGAVTAKRIASQESPTYPLRTHWPGRVHPCWSAR